MGDRPEWPPHPVLPPPRPCAPRTLSGLCAPRTRSRPSFAPVPAGPPSSSPAGYRSTHAWALPPSRWRGSPLLQPLSWIRCGPRRALRTERRSPPAPGWDQVAASAERLSSGSARRPPPIAPWRRGGGGGRGGGRRRGRGARGGGGSPGSEAACPGAFSGWHLLMRASFPGNLAESGHQCGSSSPPSSEGGV